jgi:hypothetical protein
VFVIQEFDLRAFETETGQQCAQLCFGPIDGAEKIIQCG